VYQTSTATLSASQQRMWFMDQFIPAPVNTLAGEFRLSGPLDRNQVKAAFEQVVEQLPVLRQVIRSVDGHPVLATAQHPGLTLVDLSELPKAEQTDRLGALRREAAGRRFAMAESPMLAATLLQLAPQEHLLLLGAHRAVLDEASLFLLCALLGDSYRALRRGEQWRARPNDLGPYRAAEAESRARPAVQQRLAELQAQLATLAPLELPTDRTRPARAGYAAGSVSQPLGRHLADQLVQTSERLKVPAAALLRSAFQVLLHRYTGQRQLALGTLGSRTQPGSDQLLGPLNSWQLELSEIEDRTTFGDLALATVGQPVALEWLVDAVQRPRDPGRSPLFQACLRQLDGELPANFAPAQLASARLLPPTATQFDLDLLVERRGTGPRLTLTYRQDLFDAATAQRMLSHLLQLLAAGLAQPEAEVLSLPYLDPDERLHLEVDFNRTDVPYPAKATIQELFEAQVLLRPNARALTMAGQHLSYAELNGRVNQLAHFLRGQGAGRGTLIGLCLERSFDLIIAMLGVVKAGAAYVPLDPANPSDRLGFMVEDTDLRLLLTSEKLDGTVALREGGIVVVVDRDSDWRAIQAHAESNPANLNQAEDLCYVIYTSGSTGRPKGVLCTHRGIARLVSNTDILELDSETSYLQTSPLSFDPNSLEIYGPLLNGGRVVLPPPGVPTPALIGQTVREQGVNTLWLAAPLAALTIETNLADLSGLRQFMAGGDVVSLAHMRRMLNELPQVRLVNGYGPTEVTAFSVSHKITYLDPDWPSVPIGRPLHNTTAYILDDRQQLVPIGVWGELYLGGPGVARGYHNRPELNAERFLPDPFRPGPDARLYRTGDRCRWLPEGLIQFQGRLDTQLKIDGVRIEPGEVESLITADPTVLAAVVTAPVIDSRRVLVAYIVAAGPDFDVARLRSALRASLPAIMVPAHYVVLDAIPLTPNNKVDFARLPPPAAVRGSGSAPSTPTQIQLAEIWREVLGTEQIGEEDNFFDLGGQSLRAIPVLTAISARFGIDLSVQDIFDRPTLAGLAQRIEDRMLAAVDPQELARLLSQASD
jgi:amino acid adenylation domain-containing protein